MHPDSFGRGNHRSKAHDSLAVSGVAGAASFCSQTRATNFTPLRTIEGFAHQICRTFQATTMNKLRARSILDTGQLPGPDLTIINKHLK